MFVRKIFQITAVTSELIECVPMPLTGSVEPLLNNSLEMATAQRTRPRAVVGAPHRAAWKLKSAVRNSVSAASCAIIVYIFFAIIAGDCLFMNNNG